MPSEPLPQKMAYSHQALVDLIIANPTATNRELGAHFGYTAHWVGRLKSSGMFREMLAKRRSEVVDPVLAATVEEGFDMVVARSVEVLMDKLSKDSDDVPADLVLAAAQLGAKARGIGGFGAKVAPPPATPPQGYLEEMASRLRSLNRTAGSQEIVDVQAKVPQAIEVRSGGEASD